MKNQTATLIVKGYSLAEGFKALGISERTYYRWLKNKPEHLTNQINQLKVVPKIKDDRISRM
jgi:transposase-like protein